MIPSDNVREVTENNVTEKVKISGPELKTCAINAQDVLNNINKSKPFVTIFFLDCCRTYHLRNVELITRGHSETESNTDSQGLKLMPVDFGSLIIYACAPGTVAYDGKENDTNGLFTKHLLKHIKTSNIGICKMVSNVTRGVSNESNKKQVPHISGVLADSDLCLYEQRSGKYLFSTRIE